MLSSVTRGTSFIDGGAMCFTSPCPSSVSSPWNPVQLAEPYATANLHYNAYYSHPALNSDETSDGTSNPNPNPTAGTGPDTGGSERATEYDGALILFAIIALGVIFIGRK